MKRTGVGPVARSSEPGGPRGRLLSRPDPGATTGSAADACPAAGVFDRRCRRWTLDNWLRRWWAPAEDEVRLLALKPGDRVADLGAGVGYLVPALLASLSPRGSLVLVDPDTQNLSAAQSEFGRDERTQFYVGTAASLPAITDASVDRVVLSLVLCCMVDKDGALAEAWRILKPGGLLLVTYPERGRRLNPRKNSLRVTSERWAALFGSRPWRVTYSARKRLIRRHVLQKPAP